MSAPGLIGGTAGRRVLGALLLAGLAALITLTARVCFVPTVDPGRLPPAPLCGPALTDRVLFVVVDGLRADTFFSGPAFAGLRARHPEAASGIVHTTPVTMTTTGVRAMATGTLPDLYDVVHNWSSVQMRLPNVLASARERGLRTAAYGDSVWSALFPGDVDVAVSDVALPRVVYYVFAEVLLDKLRLQRLLAAADAGEAADFLVVHLVGLDHAGHRRGIHHELFQRGAERVASLLETVVARLPGTTTVIITSDHGATDSGGHGGATAAETTVPLLAFGPGIRAGGRLDLQQVDLAPTLACLIGARLPAASVGRPAVELFAEPQAQGARRLSRALGQVEATVRAAGLAGHEGGAGHPDAFAAARTRHEAGLLVHRALMALAALLVLSVLALRFRAAFGSAGAAVPWERWCWWMAFALTIGAALYRRRQLRASSLLFGTPHDLAALAAGAAMASAIYLLVAYARGLARQRVTALAAPLALVLLAEGGQPALAWGTGFILGLALALATHAVAAGRRLPSFEIGVSVVAWSAFALLALAPGLISGWPATPESLPRWAGLALFIALSLALRPWQAFAGTPAWIRRGTITVVSLLFLVQLGRGAGDDTLVVWGTAATALGMSLLGLVGCRRGRWRAPALWLGACATAALWAVLCTPLQTLAAALATWTLLAILRAAAGPPRDTARSLLLALAVVAWRWSLVSAFEGDFGLGALEVSLAYLGNPGRHVPLGVAAIVLKTWAPLLLALWLAALTQPAQRAWLLARALEFLLGIRAVHLALGIALGATSFYSTHALLGELVYALALLLGLLCARAAIAPRDTGSEGAAGDRSDSPL